MPRKSNYLSIYGREVGVYMYLNIFVRVGSSNLANIKSRDQGSERLGRVNLIDVFF